MIGFSIFPLGGSLDVVAKKLLANGTFPRSHLINLSTRAFVGRDAEQLIGGFVVLGTGTKRVLVRGVGQRLGEPPFNIPGVLSNPMITVYDKFQNIVAQNDDWGDSANAAEIQTVSAQVFAFSLGAGSADAAVLVDVTPGNYTVIVGGVGGETGVAIVEVYDTERGAGTARLANVSSRGFTGTGAEVIIPGFVILGDATMRILVRGVGETIGAPPFDVPGVLADPMLEFRDQQSGALIGSNDNWSADPDDQAATAASIAYTYAFGIPVGSTDAAKVFIVGPGQYTAVVSGVDDATGVCIVEAYESY